MKIPDSFEVGGQTIKVTLLDKDDSDDNRFGYYDSVKEEIVIFKQVVDGDGNTTDLTEYQIENTFWHELGHVFQFHSKNETSEQESSTYAAFMTQFFKSSGLRIV